MSLLGKIGGVAKFIGKNMDRFLVNSPIGKALQGDPKGAGKAALVNAGVAAGLASGAVPGIAGVNNGAAAGAGGGVAGFIGKHGLDILEAGAGVANGVKGAKDQAKADKLRQEILDSFKSPARVDLSDTFADPGNPYYRKRPVDQQFADFGKRPL